MVIIGAPSPSPGMEDPAPGAQVDVAVGRPFRVDRSPFKAGVSIDALERGRVADVGTYRIDDSADGIAAVKQRCRPAHDFNSFEAGRIDRNTVVA